MFQRFKSAIDRTIAEEQARQQTATQPRSPSRTGSTSSRKGDAIPGQRAKSRKQASDLGDAPNPDPAVFEAAFVIDDSDEPSRAATPLPPTGADADNTNGQENVSEGKTPEGRGAKDEASMNKGQDGGTDAPATKPQAPKPQELSPEIRQKLRKLEKLEATYPELLRSYRVAHRRATAIEPFEKALRENTPLTSISDPDALVEYLNQVNLRSDMVMQELKKVSTDKEELQKKYNETEERARKLEEKLATAKSASADQPKTGDLETSQDTQKDKSEDTSTEEPEKSKSPVSSVMGMFSPKHKPQKPLSEVAETKESNEEFFSYDDEIPQLQADVASKSQEIEKLKSKVGDLQKELTTARETSTGLVESLESATRELSETRDAATVKESLQAQLDDRNKEITNLNQRLEEAQAQLKQLEEDKNAHTIKVDELKVSMASSDKRASQLDAELAKASNAKTISKKLIDDLNSQIDTLKKERSDSESKVTDLTKKLESKPTPASAATPTPAASQPTAASATAASGGGKKKNNKKKKGKGGASSAAAPSQAPAAGGPVETLEPATTPDAAGNAGLEAEIARLKEEVVEKDMQIDRLSKKRKTEEDLREEIESLQENLLMIGQDHVEAKDKIKDLEAEKLELRAQITDLEKKISSSTSDAEAGFKLQSEMDSIRTEYNDLKEKTSTLQADLGAAQQLAQNRFKDLTELREVLQKAQPELKSLRQESATLKATKEELANKTKELRDMEKREKDLKRDVERVQKLSSDRETEIKSLQEKLTVETNAKLRLEDAQRVSGRDLRRSEAEKAEVGARADKAEQELQAVQEELGKLRPKIKELEEQMHKLKREKTAAQEEVDFKTQQYSNAQGLLSSMRDQTAEMSVQLKESKSQAESLEEELAEVQRLLQERTREGETMRRLLADVDERADNKVRDMRVRMEAAVEERDRIEDESATLARRKTRETEDLKQKLKDLEREVKTLTHERDELEQREKEWRKRREELESVEEKAEAEADELRTTASQLRTALDASEKQVRDVEKQRAELRRMLEESRQRYEKLSKDLKAAQTKLVASSSRSSFDSVRSGSNGSPAGAPDTVYLKTILLQFLEQKDTKLRAQLVPVLGKLLRFDKTDEQKWQKAVQHIEVK
ncbi:hypothetical protein ACHAPO_011836 [Fusarium lateritium]